MKIKLVAIALGLSLLGTGMPNTQAAPAQLSLTIRQTPSSGEALITFYGTVKPVKANLEVEIEIRNAGVWERTRFSTKSTKVGTWKITALATALQSKVVYRARTASGGVSIYSPLRTISIRQIAEISEGDPALLFGQFGPGGRIHGADISRWQHPNDQSIDFVKMYNAGMRFVMIKASDTRDESDALALKYLVMDHSAAQAAGIYTGFYHYAQLPDVNDEVEIIRDATAQAQKAVWRLASIGGYTERDLPYALDLENKCVRESAFGTCEKSASRKAVTLWATTFLKFVKDKTGKTPFLYSYSSFLEGSMERSAELAQYPLWIAHYAIDPANPVNQPGIKTGGCYVHSWTGANCDSQWMVWQYSSCGIAPKYGVPGSRLDLNVFRGTPQAFMDLLRGSWTPQLVDLMPINEPSALTILAASSSDTNKPVNFKISVVRPDLTPVVTGSVKLVFDSPIPVSQRPNQRETRAASGVWALSVNGLMAGSYSGKIVFKDLSQTHAQSSQPVVFTIEQGAEPTATPTPSKKPTKRPSTDGCAKQIKN